MSIVVAMFLFVACTEKEDVKEEAKKAFDYGKVVNNIYKNRYFDFEINLPSDWSFQTKEEMDALLTQGMEVVAGDDENLKAVMKASEIQTASLLMGFKHPRGAAVAYNPSIMLIAENITNTPGIKSGKEYLFHSKKIMKSSKVQYDEISEEFEKVTVDGVDFYLMKTKISFGGIDIKQLYYSSLIKEFCVNVILSYSTEEEKEELMKSFNSFKRR